MNKNKFVVIICLISLLIVFSGCVKETRIFSDKDNITISDIPNEDITTPEPVMGGGIATPPTKIELSLSKAPALGETVELTAIIWYTGKIKENMSKTIAQINLPEGFELVSGDTTWTGYIKNEPQQFSIQIKAFKIGNWTIESKIWNLGRQGGGFDYLYVSVLEDKGIISEESFPLPKREGSDMGTKLNDSEILPNKTPINKSIITPEPVILKSATPPMKINISVFKAPALDEVIEITANVWYTSKIKENMPFEAGSNATYTKDYSGHGKDGNVSGATYNPTGGYDGFGAYDFDGIDDFIRLGNSTLFNITGNVSISMWLKSDTVATYDVVLMKSTTDAWNDGYGFWIDNGIPAFPKIKFFVNNYLTSAYATLSTGNWHYVVGIYNGTATRIFVDGAEGTIANGVTSFKSNNAPLEIGRGTSNLYNYDGIIDDIIIWNRTLSSEQIKFIFENKTNMLSSSETITGDIWQVNVTVNDGIKDSKSVESNYIKIL